MLTQKIFHTKPNIPKLIFLIIISFGMLLVFSGFISSHAGAVEPTCASPKDKKAVDPECAKSGRVTLTEKQAKQAGLENRNADEIVAKTLNGVYTLVAIMAVIAIVLGGIRITIADGDASKVAAGRQTVIYAVVGLAVVGSAFIITGIVQGIGTK